MVFSKTFLVFSAEQTDNVHKTVCFAFIVLYIPFDVESYEELIDLYFKTDFNKIGKFKDKNGKKKKAVLSFPHFMSDTIRGNLANRLWK